MQHATTPPSTPLRWLALGDSYTIGEGVAEQARWPVVLAAQLRQAGIDIAPPRLIATTGWTTDELSASMDAAEPLGRWDFISLLIGVNNQYRGRSVADYRGEFHDLLRRAIALAGGRAGHVLVLSIPDWGVTPFAIAQGRDRARISTELDAYNAAAADLCARHGAAWVDITAASRAHGNQADMLVDDDLHPAAPMYALWVAQALPVARGLLAGVGASASEEVRHDGEGDRMSGRGPDGRPGQH